MANDENKFLPIFQILDIKNVSFLLKLEMAHTTTITMKFEPVWIVSIEDYAKNTTLKTNRMIKYFIVSWLLISKKEIHQKDSFHLLICWMFLVLYLFKICSWHHKLSHLFSIHALFHCTTVHCWIVDKSRFLSLEKFESLWLVPLRCCELATLGAFFSLTCIDSIFMTKYGL